MLTPRRLISCALFLIITFAATFAQTTEVGIQRAAAATNVAAAVVAKTNNVALGAQGGDTTPAGMVAFFSPTTPVCPVGWVARDATRGRLILGVIDASRVGLTYGQPMADRTPPTHSHTYSANVKMGSKSIQAGKGNNKDGAKAKTYKIEKSTGGATLELPFYQLAVCQKQ